MRGSAVGRGRRDDRADEDFWGTDSQRPGRAASGNGSSRMPGPGAPRRAAPGARQAGYAGYAGESASGLTGSRTALREQPRDFWDDDARSGRGTHTGLGERTSRGSGSGSGGRRGGGQGGRGGRSGGPDPRTRRERFTNWLLYGSWWRHWTVKKALAVLGGGIAVCILLGIGGFFLLYSMTPIPSATDLTANWQSSTVYFANGKQLGTFDDSVNGVDIDRQLLTTAQIPTLMTQAMTAAEDRHFYTEGGVSVTGLARAAIEDVFGNGNLQGGSTITMQYAKNYYNDVDTGRNASTKFKEIFIAMKLGHEKSKSWVMTNYLNTVPFGATVYGLGAASENYFDVNLAQPNAHLTVAQAAMLAAMPNSPGFFNPDPTAGAGYTALVARWKYVLTNMVRDGDITQSVANAQTFPKLTPPPAGNGQTGVTGYLMNMVEQQLEAPKADGGYALTQQQIDTGGYKIRTTFSMAKVNALARAVNEEKAQMRDDGLPAHTYDRIGAVLEDSKTGAIVAIYGGNGYGSKHCNQTNCYINNAEAAEPVGSSFKPYVLSAAVNAGMDVFTSKLNGYSPIWIPVGSNSPSVTAATLETTLSPTSPPPGCSSQASYCSSTNGIQYFKFDEADENSGQPLPVNVAAAISSDPAFEDLAHRVGIDNVINMAGLFGVGQTAFVEPCPDYEGDSVPTTIADCNDLTGKDFKNRFGWHAGNGLIGNFSTSDPSEAGRLNGTSGSPAIALGENPLTPVEQASTFATLADDGIYHTPHVIASLQQGTTTIPSNLQTKHVLTAASAADVDWALSFDNNYSQGTAEGSISFRRGDVIGKTGTLGSGADASQAWFIGATPDQDALSVALFTSLPGKQNLDNLPTAGGTPGSQGGAWPATIWNAFMTAEFTNSPVISLFPQVNGAPYVPWIQATAKQTKPTCRPGQFQNCTCPTGDSLCSNPNPTPSCQPFLQQCTGTSPTPEPSCQDEFGTCTSTAPTPDPTVTSCSPSTTIGVPCDDSNAETTAKLTVVTSAGSSPPPPVTLAADEASVRGSVLMRVQVE